MKIVIHYDYTYNSSFRTTAVYMESAFRELGHTVVRSTDNTDGADLILNIDPCGELFLKEGVKCFYWEIDSYRHKGSKNHLYPPADWIFYGSNPRDSLHYDPNKSSYLPLGCDPSLHCPIPVEKEFDIAFLGRIDASYSERERLIELLKLKYKVHITSVPSGIEYSRELSRAKLIFNRSAEYDINMRFFEGMAVGCLVSNFIPEQNLLAQASVHYAAYTTEQQLFDVVDSLLADENKRFVISQRSRLLVETLHSYKHRALSILSCLKYLS